MFLDQALSKEEQQEYDQLVMEIESLFLPLYGRKWRHFVERGLNEDIQDDIEDMLPLVSPEDTEILFSIVTNSMDRIYDGIMDNFAYEQGIKKKERDKLIKSFVDAAIGSIVSAIYPALPMDKIHKEELTPAL